MAQWIRHSERVEVVEYCREFTWADDPGAGFSFECDQAGNVAERHLQPAGLSNYQKCISGELDVVDRGVRTYRHSYTEPGAIKCDTCGREVVLYDPVTSACDHCGQLYNGGGQRLAPPEQWGEETGETWADIYAGYDEGWFDA